MHLSLAIADTNKIPNYNSLCLAMWLVWNYPLFFTALAHYHNSNDRKESE